MPSIRFAEVDSFFISYGYRKLRLLGANEDLLRARIVVCRAISAQVDTKIDFIAMVAIGAIYCV